MQGPLAEEYKENKYDEVSGMEYSPFTPLGDTNNANMNVNMMDVNMMEMGNANMNMNMNMNTNMNTNSSTLQSLTPGNIELHNNLQSLRTPPEFGIKSELSPRLESQDGRRRTTSASASTGKKENSVSGEMSEDKKKAQNRAAQRAFRERKEAKFKELQRKVRESEIDRDQLLKELEKLRKWNMEINAENRKLLQKERFGPTAGGSAVATGGSPSSQSLPTMEGIDTTYIFPSTNECFEQAVNQRDNVSEQAIERKPVYSAAGRFLQYQDEFPDDTLLTVPETWEYLSQLSETEEFDVNEVMEKLVGLEQCHPSGPAYSKIRIDNMVQQSIENNR